MSRFSVTSFKNETYFRNELTAISVTWTAQNCEISSFLSKTVYDFTQILPKLGKIDTNLDHKFMHICISAYLKLLLYYKEL